MQHAISMQLDECTDLDTPMIDVAASVKGHLADALL